MNVCFGIYNVNCIILCLKKYKPLQAFDSMDVASLMKTRKSHGPLHLCDDVEKQKKIFPEVEKQGIV